MAKYTLMKTEGRAKRAQFETVHGTIQTPVFMNVGTIGAIKGAVSTQDLYALVWYYKLKEAGARKSKQHCPARGRLRSPGEGSGAEFSESARIFRHRNSGL